MIIRLFIINIFLAFCIDVYAQYRIFKKHSTINKKPLNVLPAINKLSFKSEVKIIIGEYLSITANGIPDHLVGKFPNKENPHTILPQEYHFEIYFDNSKNINPEPLKDINKNYRGPSGRPFGVSLNGVLFDPGTAEYWKGNKELGWNYCALGAAIPLGLDEHHAHVQPNGAYHYHGIPTGLLENLGFNSISHSPLIGWSADGYPVYALNGYNKNNPKMVIQHRSSFRLKNGFRPHPPNGPGGKFDGTFIQDYEFIKGLGTLDKCNGCFTITPEFPEGTYAYFLTEEWPIIPRYFKGKAINLRFQ